MRNNLAATFCRGPADELAIVASSSSAVVRYLHGMVASHVCPCNSLLDCSRHQDGKAHKDA